MNLIAMSSITYALKAKKLLASRGIRCEIARTPKNLGTGCGYSIRVYNPAEEIIKLLDEKNIKYTDYQKA